MHMKKTGWNELKRRVLALGIAAVMIGNTVDLSALPVLAMEQNQEETVETENPEQKQVQVFDTENVEQDQEQVSDEEQTFDEENAEQNQEQISGTENTEENQPSGEEGVDQEKPAEDSEEHGSETGEVTEDKTAGDEATEEVSEDVAEDTTTEEESEVEKELVEEPAIEPELALLAGEQPLSLQEADVYDVNALPYNDKEFFTIDSSNKDLFNNKTLTGKMQGGNCIVVSGVELNLTIEDLTIDMSSKYYNIAALTVRDNAVLNLTLKGENTLHGGRSGGAGICVKQGATLVVTENSTGSLTATGGNGEGGGAGIGANGTGVSLGGTYDKGTEQKVGTIQIKGGTIVAQGGTYGFMGIAIAAAGIGGADQGKTGIIEISGGTVTATGGQGAAGIGGGTDGSVEKITISGGNVTATAVNESSSGKKGAAIGSGKSSMAIGKIGCAEITISGGTVNANGNIGYSDISNSGMGFEGGSVAISGGTVTVADGCKIEAGTVKVDQDHLMHHYTLSFEIHDETLTAGTIENATVTIGENENVYKGTLSLNVENRKATGTLEIRDTTLHGEQKVSLTIESKAYETKTINLDTQQLVIWGSEPGLLLASKDEAVTCNYQSGVMTLSGNGSATVTMAARISSTEDSIQIAEGADITLTLQDVSINSSNRKTAAITIGTANVSANCELILAGNNTLVRNARLETVVDVLGKSNLTIAGNGKVVITNMGGGNDSSGIRAMDGQLIFRDNPNVEVKTGIDSVAILGCDITINGGNISAVAGIRGHGIGYLKRDANIDTEGKVTINGGTVYAEGGSNNTNAGGITCYGTQVVVTGGNVNMNRINTSNPKQLHKNRPTDPSGTELWCTIIQVGRPDNYYDTLSRNAKVLDLTVKTSSGQDYQYNFKGMYTDGDGNLYLWLPADSEVTKVVTVNGTYTGTCVTNTETRTDCNRNQWGTASEEFKLEGGYWKKFIPVTDITLKTIPNTVGTDYDLSSLATVSPENATNKDIIWELDGQQLNGNSFRTDTPRTYTLTATIQEGAGGGESFKKTFTLNMKKSVSINSLKIEGWTYGEKPNQPTYTIDPEALIDSEVIEYSTSENGDYTSEVPVNAGDYWVQVRIPETGSTVECVSRKRFTISSRSVQADGIQAFCEEQYFTGKEITPDSSAIIVFDKGNPLGTNDYKIVADRYHNNRELSTADASAYLTIEGTGNYKDIRQIPFSIVNKQMDVSAIVSTADWTNQAVIISAPEGYTICQKKDSYDYDNDFAGSYIFDKESETSAGTDISYLLKENSTGAISAEKTINVKIDQTKPSFEGTGCGILLDTENAALKQDHTFAFDLYKQVSSATVSLKAEDQPSGVKDYFYHVDQMKASEKNSYQVKTAAELAAQESGYWTTGSTIELNEEGFYVIYAYAVDQAGNQSDYICSRGIVLDVTAPTWTGRLGNIKADSAEILLETDEDSTCEYFLSETEVDADKITDEQWKSVDVKETQNGRAQTLTLAVRPTTQYYVYLRMHDPTGNVTDVQTLRFRTPARPSSGGSHKSNKDDTTTSAGTPAPTLPAAPAETPKRDLSTVKLPGAKTEDKIPAGEADVKEPHVSGDEGKSGWDVIKDELKDALRDAQDQTDGPATVKVDMNGATVVPGDIFDSVKGLDIDVVFDMGDGITWTVNGMDITADRVNDIDFGVTTGENAGQSIPVDVINNVTGERYSMNLSLAYDGAFGFQAVLTVNMDQKNAGLYANLFYYNEDSGELEFICAGEIGSDGNVDLTFSHASDYVVVIDAQPMGVAAADTDASDTVEDAQQAGAVETVSGQNSGSMLWIVLLVIAVILAGAGIILVRKGKKKEE